MVDTATMTVVSRYKDPAAAFFVATVILLVFSVGYAAMASKVTAVGGFFGMHGDVHDVFVDPANSKHVFAGDDGGLWISFDGANKWWKTDNLPISQYYHVSLDGADPYHI